MPFFLFTSLPFFLCKLSFHHSSHLEKVLLSFYCLSLYICLNCPSSSPSLKKFVLFIYCTSLLFSLCKFSTHHHSLSQKLWRVPSSTHPSWRSTTSHPLQGIFEVERGGQKREIKEYISVIDGTAPPCVFQTFAHPTSP